MRSGNINNNHVAEVWGKLPKSFFYNLKAEC